MARKHFNIAYFNIKVNCCENSQNILFYKQAHTLKFVK